MPSRWQRGLGFNTKEAWREYVTRVLVPLTSASASCPVVVLSDGHRGRLDLRAMEIAKEYNIHIFLLPPNTTHILCVLDTHCFCPMKSRLTQLTKHFNTKYFRADLRAFVGIFQQAYEYGLKAQNITNGFRDNGLWPPSWDMMSKRCDKWRARKEIAKAADVAVQKSYAEEVEAAQAQREFRHVRVTAEYAIPPPSPAFRSPTKTARTAEGQTCNGSCDNYCYRHRTRPCTTTRPCFSIPMPSSVSTGVTTESPSKKYMMTSTGTQKSPEMNRRSKVGRSKKPSQERVLQYGGHLNSDGVVRELSASFSAAEDKKLASARRKREAQERKEI